MVVQMDTIIPKGCATPIEAPLHMPAQDFSFKHKVTFTRQGVRTWLARLITFGGGVGLTVYATYQMILIVSQPEITVLQWIMVTLFMLTFVWIALAACGALAGFLLGYNTYLKQELQDPTKKTVLLMPVYNEEASQTCAALLSMGKSLVAQGLEQQFEIFIISDTNKADLWVKETAAVKVLQDELDGDMAVWYRRRADNKAKKAGNVHDFVSRWGARYDYMVVLDADSLLSADTLKALMAEMQGDPKSGIIQSLPCLFRGDTLYARLQQFAGSIYGPIVAQGITAWQGDDGNYWGHNAIIRIDAFATTAGLPRIQGPKPFEGDILSHDFVEAALMRRAGWTVRMLPQLKGSWEESPPSLADVAVRDRRWAQGNIQHLAVIPAKGLRWPNRFHMLNGVMGYMASPLWFALILVGIAMAIQIHYAHIEYFSDELSLLPHWPVFDSQRMVELFIMTMGILLVPKMLGLIRASLNTSLRRSLGIIRMSLGALVEIFFSVLYAPIFMLIHCKHVFDIFRGKDSGWSTQQRQYIGVPWAQVFKQHIWHTLIGVGMSVVLWFYAQTLFLWLAPTLVGLLLSIPLSALSGSRWLAKVLRKGGVLTIAEEVDEPHIMRKRDEYEQMFTQKISKIDLMSIITDNNLRQRHFSMTLSEALPERGVPPINKLSALHKIADAENAKEALSWLNNQEKLCLLNSQEVFEKMQELAKTTEHNQQLSACV